MCTKCVLSPQRITNNCFPLNLHAINIKICRHIFKSKQRIYYSDTNVILNLNKLAVSIKLVLE